MTCVPHVYACRIRVHNFQNGFGCIKLSLQFSPLTPAKLFAAPQTLKDEVRNGDVDLIDAHHAGNQCRVSNLERRCAQRHAGHRDERGDQRVREFLDRRALRRQRLLRAPISISPFPLIDIRPPIPQNQSNMRLATLCALLLSLTAPLAAQEISAELTGHVTDGSGGSIVKAAVTARDLDRGTVWPTVTNEDGIYIF